MEVRDEGMAIVLIPSHQQIRQQIQHPCPNQPALLVVQPSHPEGAVQDPPEVASRFPCSVLSDQQTVAPAVVLALPEAWPALLADSAHVAMGEVVPCAVVECVLEGPWCL